MPRVRLQGPVHSFHMSLWWPAGYVAAAAAGIGVPLAVAIVAAIGWAPPIEVLLAAVAVAVAADEALALLGVLALVAYFPVRVAPAGLGGFDPWGRYRELAWADIRSARPVNVLGLRYVRAYAAEDRATLSVPLFLHDRDGFCRLVRAYAGPEHPLARALHEDLT
jgi:hypothetical protein